MPRFLFALLATVVVSFSATPLASTFHGHGEISLSALDSPLRSAEFLQSLGLPSPMPFAAKECCKICTKGKACGDTCIAREKVCHQPPGCACDG